MISQKLLKELANEWGLEAARGLEGADRNVNSGWKALLDENDVLAARTRVELADKELEVAEAYIRVLTDLNWQGSDDSDWRGCGELFYDADELDRDINRLHLAVASAEEKI
jgi:hypothetical protein